MRTGHGRDSPLSPAETVSAPRLPRDSHTLARAPRLGILNSVGRSFNVISGETEAQCVQGDLHKAGDNLQLTPVTPGSRTPVQSTTPCSPPKLFFGSIFSINHLTFSFFFFFLNKIQFIHTPWYFFRFILLRKLVVPSWWSRVSMCAALLFKCLQSAIFRTPSPRQRGVRRPHTGTVCSICSPPCCSRAPVWSGS